MPARDGRALDARSTWLVVYGVIAASLCVVAGLGPLADARAAVLAAWLIGQAAWWVAFERAERSPFGARAVLLGALLLRALALASDARLSDDVYRYVWEGELLARGRSPWAASPAAPELAAERARLPELVALVNHREIPAAYPPLYVAANALVARGATLLPSAWFEGELARSVFAFRLAATAADLAVVVVLLALCRRRGRPSAAALAWAWSPLVALEFAGSAHMDSLALALWLGGLAWLAARERSHGAWTLVGAAAAIKLLPGVSAILGAGSLRSPRPLVLTALVGTASLGVFLALDEGARGALGGISEYSFRWETPNLVHRFVEDFLGLFLSSDGSLTDPRRLSRACLLAAWLAFVAWLVARRVEPLCAAGRSVGAFLVLTPTLHPWYAVWILPFLALEPRRSWALLVALVPLAYWPLADWVHAGVWREPWWLWPVLALPFFALRVREARAARA